MGFYDLGIGLINAFLTDCREAGFEENMPVKLTSEIDNSTLFVGSSISVFKSKIPNLPGPFTTESIVQPCLRTRNMKYLSSPELPEWGSYFTALGLFGSPDQLAVLHRFICKFLFFRMGITKERLVFRASAFDNDILRMLSENSFGCEIEKNKLPPNRYIHQYGLDDLTGNNYNFGVRQDAGNVLDIGNLVIISRLGRPVALDLGLGLNTMICRKLNIAHPLMCSPLADLMEINSSASVKLADAMITVYHLLCESLRPSSTSRGKILRTYLQSIPALAGQARLSLKKVIAALRAYDILFGVSESSVVEGINRYLLAYTALKDGNHSEINKQLTHIF